MLSANEAIKKLEFLKCKKNAELDFIQLSGNSRTALQQGISAIRRTQRALDELHQSGITDEHVLNAIQILEGH